MINSVEGGWENIVNDPVRKACRRREEKKQMMEQYQQKMLKYHKMMKKALLVAAAAALIITFGVIGLLPFWLSCIASFVLVCAACFLAGGALSEFNG